MEDEILDYFDEDHSSGYKIIAIKYFYFESKARLYAARLESEGIPSFVSNTNSITAFPLGDAGIGLHIREADREAAAAIIRGMDQRAEADSPEGESFREADQGDINYQRALHERKTGANRWLQYAIGLIIVLVIVRMLWRTLHPDGTWDLF